MIKIHKQLWYVVKPEDKDNLAYMCQYDQAKDGEPLSSVVKMQATGRSWARVNSQSVWKRDEKGNYIKGEHGCWIEDYKIRAKEGEEFIVDNTPTEGFYVGCSVSRWSTSNKVFRVKDPRGFTVEIPTDNLATLLHHTTVVKGVVQEACVWGREGNNHILLPVNSEPYLMTLDQMDTLENKLISLKDLKVGDWVKMFEDKTEYYYAGKVRGTWKIRGYNSPSYWDRDKTARYSDWVEVKDDKWTDVFLQPYRNTIDGSKYSVNTFSKPKIVEVLRNEPMAVKVEEYSWYCPQRVVNRTNLYDNWQRTEKELVGVEIKINIV